MHTFTAGPCELHTIKPVCAWTVYEQDLRRSHDNGVYSYCMAGLPTVLPAVLHTCSGGARNKLLLRVCHAQADEVRRQRQPGADAQQ